MRAARCDGGCRSDLQTNTPRWSCAVCDFDLCAVCGGGLAVSPQPTGATQLAEDCGDVGASLPVIMPTSLPCLMCDACTDPAFPPAKRSRLGPSGCQFACGVWKQVDTSHELCARCCNSKNGVLKCSLRLAVVSAGAPDAVAGAPDAVAGAAKAAKVDPATPSGATPGAGVVSTPPPPDPPTTAAERLEALPEAAPERRIVSNPRILLVVCTISALRLRGEAAAVLREALGQRGVRRIFIDELHTLTRSSMAGWSEDLADTGPILDSLRAALHRHGHRRRPQHVGFTSTLPPPLVQQAADAARMQKGVRVVRCSIDRPDLCFYRLPFPPRAKETHLLWAQRLLTQLTGAAPSWAAAGSLVVFCPTTDFAVRACAELVVHDSDGRVRPNLVFLGVRKMCGSERDEQLDAFARLGTAVLFTTEAFSHGAGKPGITMVIHLALPKGPIEMFQRSGRGAREEGESALVVFVVSAHMLQMRVTLSNPAEADSLSGARLLLRHLTSCTCPRAALLEYLGQPNVPLPCSGCDFCGGPRLGSLSHLLTWEDGTAAAISLCDCADLDWERGVSLGAILRTIPFGAPAPFHAHAEHCALVVTLLGDGTLSFDGASDGHGHSFARCRPHNDSLRTLRDGMRRVDVLLLQDCVGRSGRGDAGVTPPSGASPAGGAVEACGQGTLSQNALVGVHQIMLDVARAESLLTGARRRMNHHLTVEEDPIAILEALSELSPSQERLLFRTSQHTGGGE